MLTFYVVYLFLQVLSKKSIWRFDVSWSIYQQFILRDLKPVALLVFNQKEAQSCQFFTNWWKALFQFLTSTTFFIFHCYHYVAINLFNFLAIYILNPLNFILKHQSKKFFQTSRGKVQFGKTHLHNDSII